MSNTLNLRAEQFAVTTLPKDIPEQFSMEITEYDRMRYGDGPRQLDDKLNAICQELIRRGYRVVTQYDYSNFTLVIRCRR